VGRPVGNELASVEASFSGRGLERAMEELPGKVSNGLLPCLAGFKGTRSKRFFPGMLGIPMGTVKSRDLFFFLRGSNWRRSLR